MFSVQRSIFGVEGDTTVYRYDIGNGAGVSFSTVSYGATIISIKTPDRNGASEEITLSRTNYEDLKNRSRYFGCIAGRVANRIRKGQFELDGVQYQLAINNGVNALHGGLCGFDKRIWTSKLFMEDDSAGVIYSYVSADGEEGYPGELTVHVKYSLTLASQLRIEYSGSTTKATPVNLTNHAYFNLSGDGARRITEHYLHLSCSQYLPVDSTQIPTGELRDCLGTPFDFTPSAPDYTETLGVQLGTRISAVDGGGQPGLDHCFVVQRDAVSVELRHAGTLSDPITGRTLTVATTSAGMQVYTGNFLSTDQSQAPYVQHNSICLETQQFPDAINQPSFPNCVLRPGELLQATTVFTFGTI